MSEEADFPLQFGTVAIVGVGLIGGSLGMALKTRRLAHQVVGIGRDPKRLQKALDLGAIDVFTTDLCSGVREADCIVLCTTIRHIIQILPEVMAAARHESVITDVGSTKGTIVAAAQSDGRFVGGHPMAGSERGGVEAATPILFEEATWAITPAGSTDPETLRRVRALAQEVGASTLIVSPEDHDAMAAVTSHLPHVLATALMRQAAAARETTPEITRLAAGSFADATRVAASSPEIWRDVCLTNRDAVLTALHRFRRELDRCEEAVRAGDAGSLEKFFAQGAAAKRDWNAL